jgi:formylglycine-generating enzyme required for sulfatase activity
MQNALWAAIALQCKKNGFQPHGNNNYGSDAGASYEKGVAATKESDGRTARTRTGSGPVTWSHDNTIAGICDMNGLVWEWSDMRLVNGEIQIIPNSDSMLASTSLASTSAAWKAIKPDGTLVAAGNVGDAENRRRRHG